VNTAFYCVVNERYFLGAVGLINSLRLVGHTEPIHVLDCGLRRDQRDLLGSEATVVAGPTDAPAHVLKTIAPLSHPAETCVLIDVDMIATRPLDVLIAAARQGKVVAGATGMDRFCPEWAELLGLAAVSRRTYVSTGLVVVGGALGHELLELVDDHKHEVDWKRTFWEDNDESYPLVHADQDLINAAIAARADEDELIVFDARLSPSPPFTGLEVRDVSSLRCSYEDGSEPLVVHHWLAKPWLEPTHHGVYSQLLSRLLVGEDVAIRIPEQQVPLRLRRGARAYVARKRVNARERFRWHVSEPMRRTASRRSEPS